MDDGNAEIDGRDDGLSEIDGRNEGRELGAAYTTASEQYQRAHVDVVDRFIVFSWLSQYTVPPEYGGGGGREQA